MMTIDERLRAQDAPTVRPPPMSREPQGPDAMTTLHPDTLSNDTYEQFQLIARILGLTTSDLHLVHDTECAPIPYAVWDMTTGEILGAGESPDEAVAEALEVVRKWEHQKGTAL